MVFNVQTKPETQTTPTTPTTPTTLTEQNFLLSEITKQGQYVHRQTGHLLVVDERVESALRNGAGIFKSFIAIDPVALEYLKVTENPKLSLEEMRLKVADLKLPIGF